MSPVGRFSMQNVKNHHCKEADNSDKYEVFQCALFLEVSARTTLVLQIMQPPQGVKLRGFALLLPISTQLQKIHLNAHTYVVVKRCRRFLRLLWPYFIPCACLEKAEISCFSYFCRKGGKYRASFIKS